MNASLIASAVLFATGLTCAIHPAMAADPELRHVRLCDTSVCYYAWNIVDSDGDGVSDADEIMAGSDPYDAKSRPPLEVIVTLVGKQQLPSFEFGLGKVILYPDKLQETIEAGTPDPLAAFPLGKRKDGLSRMGLSPDLLAEHGIDADHDGFTLTFDTGQNSGLPARHVGGVDISLISAGDDEDLDLPAVTEIYNYDDGATGYKLDNGDFIYDGADGHGLRQDKNGKILDDWYVNPDADTGVGAAPTDEQIKAWERLRNATVRTVAEWSAIETDPSTLTKPRDLVVLIDPEYSDYSTTLSGPPTIDTAQPETRPDLPNPQEPGTCKPYCN
jgi:hypothetical protein